jgi:antitoxin ParD1/3/4
MSRNTSISLGDRFVAEQVRQGRYASASEVVRAGLRLLEDLEVRREALRKMLIDGESSGFVDYSFEGLMAELDQQDPSGDGGLDSRAPGAWSSRHMGSGSMSS